jgi:hypothetical protein
MLITNKCLRRRLYLIAFPARTDAGRDMAYALLPSPLPGPGSVEVASAIVRNFFLLICAAIFFATDKASVHGVARGAQNSAVPVGNDGSRSLSQRSSTSSESIVVLGKGSTEHGLDPCVSICFMVNALHVCSDIGACSFCSSTLTSSPLLPFSGRWAKCLLDFPLPCIVVDYLS